MAAPMAQARLALRLLQFSTKARFFINQRRQVIGIYGQACRQYSDDNTKDDDVIAKSKIELSHPKGKRLATADLSSSSSSDSNSDSDSSSSSDSDEEKLGAELVSSAGDVAKMLGGDTKQTTSDLLNQLRSHHKISKDRLHEQLPRPDLSQLIGGMRVQRQRQRQQPNWQLTEDGGATSAPRWAGADGEGRRRRGPAQADSDATGSSESGILGQLLEGHGRQQGQRQQQREKEVVSLTLFDGDALGIFPQAAATKDPMQVVPESLFARLTQAELRAATTMPAENAFDEQIRWTREGKLWTFPINNEQGMDEEAKVGFHEHIFLEPLIADFPRKGPVRHFMELVCVGLSKNCYLTVEEKHAHIDWFRNYFNEKKQILDDIIIDPDTIKAGSDGNVVPKEKSV